MTPDFTSISSPASVMISRGYRPLTKLNHFDLDVMGRYVDKFHPFDQNKGL